MRVVFTGGLTLPSFLIGLRTRSFVRQGWRLRWISHALVVLDDGRAFEASFTTQRVHVFRWSGRVPGFWSWEVDLADLLAVRELAEARRRLMRAVDVPYDSRGVLAYLIDRPEYNDPRAFYCFELVRHALPMITGKAPARTVGRHLWRGLRRLVGERGASWSERLRFVPG